MKPFAWLLFSLIKGDSTEHLNSAKKLMAAGEYDAALVQYDKAIALDSKNHVTYFRRGAAYMILGRNDHAIRDFNQVLELRKDNHAARLKRADLYFQQGNYDKAIADYEMLGSNDQAMIKLDDAKKAVVLQQTILQQPSACLMDEMSDLIRISPRYIDMLLKRADCFLNQNELEQASGDYSRVIKFNGNNNQVILKLAELYTKLGELDNTIKTVKECLKSDPDHKACKKLFKSVKKIQKKLVDFNKVLEKQQWRKIHQQLYDDGLMAEIEAFNSPILNKHIYLAACMSFNGRKRYDEAIDFCSRVLDIDVNILEARVCRGEALLAKEEYDRAKQDFATAHESDRHNQRIVDGYRKAELGIKKRGMRDYYKTLGVARDATAREIKKAYRKMAQQYHPDKYRGEMSSEQVQEKMAEINQAYETLSNEELRQRYDQGDDPNVTIKLTQDPNQQGQQFRENHFGGFPNFNGFEGFHGFGGQQFKFHF